MAVLWKDRKRIFGMPISFTRYILEEDRLILREGFFKTIENEIMLYRVQDITLVRTLFSKLLGVGTIELRSSDKSHPVLFIRNIRKASAAKKLISDNVELERLKRRVGTHEFITEDMEGMDDDFDE